MGGEPSPPCRARRYAPAIRGRGRSTPSKVCSNGNRDEARQACQDPQELRGGMAGKMEYYTRHFRPKISSTLLSNNSAMEIQLTRAVNERRARAP